MAVPKILVIPGSLRAKSYNVRLAALATKELMLADADVTRISLVDYPLPIYDADSAETAGPPPNPRTRACSSPVRNTTLRLRR
jgi:NAD(P)H-dependent FMN reductase